MDVGRLGGLVGVIGLVVAACGGGAGSADPDSLIAVTTPTESSGVTALSPPSPSAGSRLAVPEVDLSKHSVPLEDVHFDTFDGGSVPLSASTQEMREALLDAIPPIDEPVYGDRAAGDWLAPDDLVLGYVAGDQAYAYPFKILNFHEIVNDELAGIPVLISYCPLCRSGVVYDRRLDGQTLSFGNTSALYESDLVMVDRATGSYWWQVAGTAIVGSLTDATLEPLPSTVATWAGWTSNHPDTLVLTRDTGYTRPYEQDSFVNYADFLDTGQFPFPVGEAARDPRLAPSALVVGVVIDGEVRAYLIDDLTDPIGDEVGGQAIVIFPVDGGASVFSATVAGETLEFQDQAGEVVDVGSGSVWDSTGVARSGVWQGTSLDPIPSRTTFWFALAGAFPEVELYSG